MLKNLISNLQQYSSIGIFGFGKEGRSFDNFAKKYLNDVKIIIIDQSNGKNYLDDLSKVDVVIKSPGISLYNLGIKYDDYPFTSMTELFIKHFSKQIIGITGTKGKSTLSTILYNLLKNNGDDTVLCGNIGLPPFDILDNISKDTKIVMELSSHQLSDVKYSPHIGVLTNLFPEHLDYYESCDSYYEAKQNIFNYQNKDDIAILNCTNELKYNVEFDMKKGYIHKGTLQILEKLIELFNINSQVYLKTLNEFKTLPHRLEYIGKYQDINFINDSISTIPQATIEAIKILKDVDSLILGGFDRGVDYNELVNFLVNSEVKHIFLYSQTGKILKDLFKSKDTIQIIIYKETLKEVVDLVFKYTKKEKICLFSPAAASFDSYKNFEHRGEEFKRIVKLKLLSE